MATRHAASPPPPLLTRYTPPWPRRRRDQLRPACVSPALGWGGAPCLSSHLIYVSTALNTLQLQWTIHYSHHRSILQCIINPANPPTPLPPVQCERPVHGRPRLFCACRRRCAAHGPPRACASPPGGCHSKHPPPPLVWARCPAGPHPSRGCGGWPRAARPPLGGEGGQTGCRPTARDGGGGDAPRMRQRPSFTITSRGATHDEHILCDFTWASPFAPLWAVQPLLLKVWVRGAASVVWKNGTLFFLISFHVIMC